MDKLVLIHQKDKLLFPEIIYNKPINKQNLPRISLVGGSGNGLQQISTCYETIMLSNAVVEVILPEMLKGTLNISDAIYLPSNQNGALSKINSDRLIETSSISNLFIIGPDIILSSETQIMIEKLLLNSKTPIILTDETIKIFSINPEAIKKHDGLIIFCDTNNLIKIINYLKIATNIQPSRAIFNLIDLVISVAKHIASPVICYNNHQIVCFDPRDQKYVGTINFESLDVEKSRGAILGLIGSFLADKSNRIRDFNKKVLTACFIARKYLEDKVSIKEILNEN